MFGRYFYLENYINEEDIDYFEKGVDLLFYINKAV